MTPRRSADKQQVQDLLVHDRPGADLHPQGVLMDDEGDLGWTLPIQQPLPIHADLYPEFDSFLGPRIARLEQSAGVVLGLGETGYDERVVFDEELGGVL